ncbi:hypothetical protein HBA54_05590 [Pelagibius litoralis]|uniref:Uncharacterized protein n=1 Tax=Pelagibius litoralis TaxID=374515 RepID=A0A967EWS1_9PROT|nr:hypothetical protein [Pelagibius litoralis]NIA68058.1 hypothetical protein [Pelagibius litoralis]
MTSNRHPGFRELCSLDKDGRPAAAAIKRSPAARYVQEPQSGQSAGLRLAPGICYVLPGSARRATVSVKDRDLLLAFENGSRLQLRDLITIEAMARSPIFQLDGRDILASIVGVMALARGDGATLDRLVRLSSEVLAVSGSTFCTALQALLRDGRLPKACFAPGINPTPPAPGLSQVS